LTHTIQDDCLAGMEVSDLHTAFIAQAENMGMDVTQTICDEGLKRRPKAKDRRVNDSDRVAPILENTEEGRPLPLDIPLPNPPVEDGVEDAYEGAKRGATVEKGSTGGERCPVSLMWTCSSEPKLWQCSLALP